MKKTEKKMKLNPQEPQVNKYMPHEIELKWQDKWHEAGVYQPEDLSANTGSQKKSEKKPFYNLMMFPYPSAEGMHVGNMYAFTGTDVYGRFKRMQGYDVFEPIGLDGFGIHSENYALKVGRHPVEQATLSEKNFYRQLKATGNGYDWTRTIETYKPEYYQWTQWVFVELFKKGLAYRKKAPVNFCPSCKTVLADEQVEDGKCERCGSIVEKRELEQWFFKITQYADRLLDNLENLDWSNRVKIAQKQWIGKSTGATISFQLAGQNETITVFTTRPDTLYGATFLVISPEHPLVASLSDGRFAIEPSQVKEVKKYVQDAKNKSEQDRTAGGKEKTGVFSGVYAVNPVTKEKIPVWIADYVLVTYGTGAIMAVPAHDQRDFEFAVKYGLHIKTVIASEDDIKKGHSERPTDAYAGDGTIVNSGDWSGWQTPDSITKVSEWLKEHSMGDVKTTYHLRDWLISRQRYWGPPIPMIFCKSCFSQKRSWFTHAKTQHSSDWDANGWYPAEDLPVELPYVDDYKPMGTGKSPLDHYESFYKTTCPGCGEEARRETDVSDTFLDSSWYFLRYPNINPKDKGMGYVWKNEKEKSKLEIPWSKEITKTWLPVTMYIGGAEHSVLHLLYSRFVTMVFHDLGFTDFEEPFSKFYAHGLLIKEGAKMSKSKGNVIVPDEYIRKYGADTLRSYLMFLGPFKDGGDFHDSGIDGMHKFMKRVWKLVHANINGTSAEVSSLTSIMHKTIKDVTEDVEALRYNTAIAHVMEYYNELSKHDQVGRVYIETLLKLLAPFAPHMTEELWQLLQEKTEYQSLHLESWPEFNEQMIHKGEVRVVVQINGKVRDTLVFSSNEFLQEEVETKAKNSDKVARFLEGQNVKKVIYVEGKVINFVI